MLILILQNYCFCTCKNKNVVKRDIFGVNVYLTGFQKVASAPLSHLSFTFSQLVICSITLVLHSATWLYAQPLSFIFSHVFILLFKIFLTFSTKKSKYNRWLRLRSAIFCVSETILINYQIPSYVVSGF